MSKLNCSKFISLHCSVDRELQRYCRGERISTNFNFSLAKSLFSLHFLLFKKVREAHIRIGCLFDITAHEVGAYLGESAYYDVGAYSRKYSMHHREEKSLCRVAMVAKFLDDNKPKRRLKKEFALFQTSSILSNFI